MFIWLLTAEAPRLRLREILKYCENKPWLLTEDSGIDLERLGLKYRHETFGERNAEGSTL